MFLIILDQLVLMMVIPEHFDSQQLVNNFLFYAGVSSLFVWTVLSSRSK